MIEKISVTFVEGTTEKTVEAPIGLSLLEVAHENGINLEGACGGALACATCHVVLEEEAYNALGEPTDAEQDMLDLVFDLTRTSRLACQIIMAPELNGIKIKVPSFSRNA